MPFGNILLPFISNKLKTHIQKILTRGQCCLLFTTRQQLPFVIRPHQAVWQIILGTLFLPLSRYFLSAIYEIHFTTNQLLFTIRSGYSSPTSLETNSPNEIHFMTWQWVVTPFHDSSNSKNHTGYPLPASLKIFPKYYLWDTFYYW